MQNISATSRPLLPLDRMDVIVKGVISKRTRHAFMYANRTQSDTIEVSVEPDSIMQITDPLEFFVFHDNHSQKVSLELDYIEGDDLATVEQHLEDTYCEYARRDLRDAMTITRADLSGLSTQLLDEFEALVRHPQALASWGDGNPWMAFYARSGESFWKDLGVWDCFSAGFRTLRSNGTGTFGPLFATAQPYHLPDDLKVIDLDTLAPEDVCWLTIGRPLDNVLTSLQTLAETAGHPLAAPVLERVVALREQVQTRSDALRKQAYQQAEARVRWQAERLVELTGDVHLKLLLEQEFQGCAAHAEALKDLTCARIKNEVIAPLVADGSLPAELTVSVQFESDAYEDSEEYEECEEAELYSYQEGLARSPSMTALKVLAGVRDWLRSEPLRDFGLDPEAFTTIHGIGDPYAKSCDLEIVVVQDLFFTEAIVGADYLLIQINKSPRV